MGLLIISIHLFIVAIAYFPLRLIVMGIGFSRGDKNFVWKWALLPGILHKDMFNFTFGFITGICGAGVHRMISEAVSEAVNRPSPPVTATGPTTALIICVVCALMIAASGSEAKA